MMCRYESRALSPSVMGKRSFRFRISALIWSRRALDAPLVERYIVPCCGWEPVGRERGKKFLRRRGVKVVLFRESRWDQVGFSVSVMSRETGRGGGEALRCAVGLSCQQMRRFCFFPSPLRKKKSFKKTFCSVSVGFHLRHSVQLGWLAAGWRDWLSVCAGRSAAVDAVSRTRSPGTVNLVEGLCSQVSYIAWDSTGAGGLPTRQHRRKTEGGG